MNLIRQKVKFPDDDINVETRRSVYYIIDTVVIYTIVILTF